MLSRSLQWERGLKYPAVAICDDTMKSFPAMGTWIEIYKADKDAPEKESFPAMGTWIEIPPAFTYSHGISLFPAMGTWIEIITAIGLYGQRRVVPCNGNVD